MIQSMTGFGTSHFKDEICQCNIEVRSLNHRHSEIRVFGLKDMLELENEIAAKVKKRFHRGKFDINISFQTLQESSGLDEKQLLAHHKSLQALAKKMGLVDGVTFEIILKTLPSHKRAIPLRKMKKYMDAGVDEALSELERSRTLEGRHLVADIQKRLRAMSKELKSVEKRSKSFAKRKFRQLQQKIAECVAQENVDRKRLELEIALLVEKSDVTEELVRLSSHFSRFQEILADERGQKGIGRKLDFFIQEINREINTVGSKVADVVITNVVVQLKSELEKVREQVQNLE